MHHSTKHLNVAPVEAKNEQRKLGLHGANDLKGFNRETSGKIVKFHVRNFHNPSFFYKLFKPVGGIPFIIIIISQSFICLSHKLFSMQPFVSLF